MFIKWVYVVLGFHSLNEEQNRAIMFRDAPNDAEYCRTVFWNASSRRLFSFLLKKSCSFCICSFFSLCTEIRCNSSRFGFEACFVLKYDNEKRLLTTVRPALLPFESTAHLIQTDFAPLICRLMYLTFLSVTTTNGMMSILGFFTLFSEWSSCKPFPLRNESCRVCVVYLTCM